MTNRNKRRIKQNKAEQSRGYLTDRRESYKSYKSYKDCKTVKIKYPTNTKEQEVWGKAFPALGMLSLLTVNSNFGSYCLLEVLNARISWIKCLTFLRKYNTINT